MAIDIASNQIGRRIGNPDDLPEALRSQLSILRKRSFDQRIINLIDDHFEGVATVSEILVGLWRQSGQVYTRHYIDSVLYKMKKKGIILPVAKFRGAYRTALIAGGE